MLKKKNIYKIVAALFIITRLVSSAIAQDENEPVVSYFSDSLYVRLSLQLPLFIVCVKPDIDNNETSIENKIREDAHITYMPNIRLSGGLGVYYKGFGATYTRKIATISNTEKRGVTDYTDIRLVEYYRKFGADLVYMDYSGFYLTDPGEHGYSVGEPETKRSDMNLKIISATGFYIFSDDFSLRAAFMQNEKQNKWDWTLLAVLSAVYKSLESDYSIIPPENETAFGNNAGLNGGIFKGIAAGAGFGVTIPYNEYLFAVVSYFGSGYMNREYQTNDGIKTDHDGFYRINAKSSLSYNGGNYFFGLSFVFDSIANYSGIRILTNTYTAEIFTGLRI